MLRRIEIYTQALNNKNPRASIPLLNLAIDRLIKVRSFYSEKQLRHFGFLLNNGIADAHKGSLKNCNDQKFTVSADKNISLETRGVFGVYLHNINGSTRDVGSKGYIELWGYADRVGWMKIKVLVETVHTGLWIEQKVCAVEAKRINLEDLVVECSPEKIWEDIQRYIGELYKWQRQGVQILEEVREEFLFDQRLLQQAD